MTRDTQNATWDYLTQTSWATDLGQSYSIRTNFLTSKYLNNYDWYSYYHKKHPLGMLTLVETNFTKKG
jgi:hypothetical protein